MKVNSRWVADLNVKEEIIRLSEGNLGDCLHDLRTDEFPTGHQKQ